MALSGRNQADNSAGNSGAAYVFQLTPDADGDGVPDGSDLCPNTIIGAPVDTNGCPDPSNPADFDNDGDVDNGDFEASTGCWVGPEVVSPFGCEDKDLDGDGDTDLADFLLFQFCFSGENIVANADCVN